MNTMQSESEVKSPKNIEKSEVKSPKNIEIIEGGQAPKDSKTGIGSGNNAMAGGQGNGRTPQEIKGAAGIKVLK